MSFFKKLFSGLRQPPGDNIVQILRYKGFIIEPTPKKTSSGWSTQAKISKQVAGDMKYHHFIRADSSHSEQGAIELIILKTKLTIDQQGEEIFKITSS